MLLQNLINIQDVGFKFLLCILNCNQLGIAIFIRTVRLIYKIIFQQRSIRKHYRQYCENFKEIFDKRIKINNDIRQ